MIVVTGAAGFIGSSLIGALNSKGYKEVVAVDDFSHPEKNKNLESKYIKARVERNAFFGWLDEAGDQVQFVFHIGARTDTAEFDRNILNELNVEYSKKVFIKCAENAIPLIYASSAATYGDGAMGFSDHPNLIQKFKPLNPYGMSKWEFDQWVIHQKQFPPFWAGFKFFNVYGANEYHKGRMASVVFHAFNQIKKTGMVKLFKSHKSDWRDGEQERDFVYIKDVHKVLLHFMENRKNSGLYNLGSGATGTFLELAKSVFMALKLRENITFIDIPEDIRETYQYYTCADLSRLRAAGYNEPFTRLSDGIKDYVEEYLEKGKYL